MKFKIIEKKTTRDVFSYGSILNDARSKAVHLNDGSALRLYAKFQKKIMEISGSDEEKLKATIRYFKTHALLEIITNRRN